VYFNADIILMDDPLSAVDAAVANHLFHKCFMQALRSKTRVLITHQLDYLSYADWIVFMKDGNIIDQGTYTNLMQNECKFHELMTNHGHIAGNPLLLRNTKLLEVEDKATLDKLTELEQVTEAEDRAIGQVSWNIYLYYSKVVGGLVVGGAIATIICVSQAASIVSGVWLSWWCNDQFNNSNSYYIMVYGVLGGVECFVSLFAVLLCTIVCLNGAKQLHENCVKSILYALTSVFDTTPSGRILNRFSKDIDTIDSSLTDSILMCAVFIFSLAGTFILISILEPYFIIAVVPIIILYLYVQSFYRISAREFKRLGSVSKSPIFSHFNETLNGLPLIRAFKQQKAFMETNYNKLNENNRAYLVQILGNRWIGIRLEMLGILVNFVTALISIIQRSSINPAIVGLIISYSINTTHFLTYLLHNSAQLENDMNSVERIKYYTDNIPTELNQLSTTIDLSLHQQNWPKQGCIQFKQFSMRYRDNLPLVLNNISITIKPHERIGIVGRTGIVIFYYYFGCI
jgi:ATP-binding cassette subfamily C (CFTR/MRP) protein 1